MSECVVRMERVPKNCDDGCWGSLSGECPWCDSIDGYRMVGKRPPNCPIICSLPENHGRLVDVSEVYAQMHKYGFLAPDMTAHEFVEDELTTIVPAEGGET